MARDPRRDLIFLLEGKRAADPGPVREMALQELEAKGFQVVPTEEADKADLWVDVIAFVDAGRGPARSASEAGREGRGGREMGGGRGSHGGHGGMQGEVGGPRRASAEDGPSLEMPSTRGSMPMALGAGVVYVVQLVDPKTGKLVWYGQMDLDAALKDRSTNRPQTLQDQIQRFLAPLPGIRRKAPVRLSKE